MKLYALIFTLLFCPLIGATQTKFEGNWEGVIIRAGQTPNQGTLLYLELNAQSSSFQGYSREEVLNTNTYALKGVSASKNGDTLSLKQDFIKNTNAYRIKWCRLKADLVFNKNTGYLEGNYKSIDCRRVMGKIILYRTDVKLEKNEVPERGQYWFDDFIYGIEEGLNAPEIRIKERENFVFEPVFFAFDKAEIHPDYIDFLNELIKVVKGHSDLRVRVVGHTDSDGTDVYNIDLSKRRAEAIVHYFVLHGLSADRLQFDFKGEKVPIDTNSTSQGKQKNRRVDFSFI
ncbi:MAG: OmpA family protein [Crocinitomicaceae bacterium]|nr:OmpA family protein [Crocinitomicaceae bacterium]MDG1777129.1 OmpA family protein [Crocinitomicaceae bacterium]